MSTILKDQFVRLRDGDRFWYESYFDAATVASLEKTRLSTIIRRNTTVGTELQLNVFLVPEN
jgi:peroxidase